MKKHFPYDGRSRLVQGGSLSKVDLTVLGAGLGGLAAAALLARQGKKIIVFAPGKEVGGAFIPARIDGYQFPLGPTLSFGNERAGVLLKLYAELGISQDDIVRSTSYQVALPDRRLTVHPEKGETLEELRREYPNEIDGITKLFHAIDKIAVRSSKSRLTSFLSRRRSSKALLQRYRFSRELLSFFDIQSRYFFGQSVHDLPVSNLVSMINTSPLYEPRGFKKMADLLLEVILKHDGIVRFSEPFPEMASQRANRVGLVTTGGQAESGAVLLNTRGRLRDTFYFMGIMDQGVPVGMRHGVICLPDYNRPDDLFSLTLSRHGDESAAPRGKRALTAWFPLRAPDRDQRESLLDPIREIIPFLDDFSDTMDVQRPDGTQYETPSAVQGREQPSMVRLEQGTSKNLYIIRDDPGHPVQAVAAAERMAEILR
jgi:phytoene dehydrogenase-like protein